MKERISEQIKKHIKYLEDNPGNGEIVVILGEKAFDELRNDLRDDICLSSTHFNPANNLSDTPITFYGKRVFVCQTDDEYSRYHLCKYRYCGEPEKDSWTVSRAAVIILTTRKFW
jgi:hypothetical protein